ncbi:hypothetical protein [Actinomadura formosensis]|uniref:hypothetical protein n=1 Tax=Actinomadura formosensis TaxID=60706 RepID=UPI000834FB6B|nr:hypothetical protein [Actinomadura formosensis]
MALVLLILTAGLPLLDKALGSGATPLAPGAVLSLGTERAGARPVTFSVPSGGWMLETAETSLANNVELSKSGVYFSVSVVVPLAPVNPRDLWDGLGRIVAAGGRSRLRAQPVPITTAHGLTGLTGHLAGRERSGMATVFAGATLGAAATASGRPDAYRRLAGEVEAMVRTLTISAPAP